MTYLALGIYVLHFLIGFMFMSLVWPTEKQLEGFLKAALAIGIGLGISSLLYFLYILFLIGQHFFIYIELTLLFILVGMYIRKNGFKLRSENFSLNSIQKFIVVIAALIFITSFVGSLNYLANRRHGDWDAWMIYNRTARFIYRNGEDWRESFSEKLDLAFHADYPLLVPLNIVSGWDTLGAETASIPMIQSILFSVACVAALASVLGLLKSIGQGALGIILLWGAPFFVNEGGRQMADMPLSFFILASVILVVLYYLEKRPFLIILAGFSAGLAAWTKNEGSLFVLTSSIALMINCFRERSLRSLYLFAVGLGFPLAATLYFKYFLAPSSEFFRSDIALIALKVFDLSRHKLIVSSFIDEFLQLGIGSLRVFPVILIYWLFFYSRREKNTPVFAYVTTTILLQLAGYYCVYLISPYDLQWHLDFSIGRLFVHLFPTFLFLVLNTSRTPEEILDRQFIDVWRSYILHRAYRVK
jgi:hypothetical protein